MARIRTVKPEFWTNEKLSELPEATHLLAAALLNYADDEGYFNANEGLVVAACSPLREPSVSIHCSLKRLAEIDYLRLGKSSDGRVYGFIVEFAQHQRVNRPTPSKIKHLKISWGNSVSPHGILTEDSLPEQGTGNREQGIKEKAHTSISGETDPPEKPLSVKKSREDRLHEVTIDAIEAYNEILAKPTGVLSRVSLTVGLPRRRQQVEKCLGTARDMCQELYGSPRITPEFWRQYWGEVALDPFRSGRQGGGRGHENWKPSFKYLVRVDTMLEVFDRATSDDSPQDEAA